MNPVPTLSPPAARLRHDLAVAAIGLVLLLAWDFSGLDPQSMHVFGDAHGFAWREHWVARTLLHDGGRWLGFVVLAALVVNVWRPLWAGPTRGERARWLIVTLSCLLAVPALKQLSATSCPWDLAEYGGVAHYVSHWSFGARDGGPGHCFPSGHATAAFAFIGGWFALRDHQPHVARRWMVAVIGFGLVFGLAQMARGAHYPSHTLWSAWLCWVISMVGAWRLEMRGLLALRSAIAR